MIKRVLIRGLRGLIFSSIGMAVAVYGNHPVWGPLITAAGLTLDKLYREITNAGVSK